jgi:hypothetical protein
MSAGDALDPALFGNLRWPLRSFRRGKVLVHKTFGASERGHLCVINSCVCAGTRIQDRENDPLARRLDLLLALRPLRARRGCDEQRAQCRFWSGNGKRHRAEKCGVKAGAIFP